MKKPVRPPLHLTALLRSHLLGHEGDVLAFFQRVKYPDYNLAAEAVRLTPKEFSEIEAVLPAGAASGERYHAQAMKSPGMRNSAYLRWNGAAKTAEQ
jgi:hypothetical protein